MLNFVPRSRQPWTPGAASIAAANIQRVPYLFGEGGFLRSVTDSAVTAALSRRARRSDAGADDTLGYIWDWIQHGHPEFQKIQQQYEQQLAGGTPIEPIDRGEFTPAQLNTMFRVPPGTKALFDTPMRLELASEIWNQWRQEQTRDSILSRYAEGHGFANEFLWGTVGFMLDPLNAATVIIPPFGAKTVTTALVRSGLGVRAATLGGLFAGGAAAGATAQGLISGTQLLATTDLPIDQYTLRDAARDVFMSATLNAAFHTTLSRQGGILSQVFGWVPSRNRKLTGDDALTLKSKLGTSAATIIADAADGTVAPETAQAVREAVGAALDIAPEEVTRADMGGVAQALSAAEAAAGPAREAGVASETTVTIGDASATVTTPQVTTISRADFLRDFTDANGVSDLNGFGDHLREVTRLALARGARVFIEVGGKRTEIVEIRPLGLVDTDGNPWGSAVIATDTDARLVIEEPAASVQPTEPVPTALHPPLRDLGFTDDEIQVMERAEAEEIIEAEVAPRAEAEEPVVIIDDAGAITDRLETLKTEAEGVAARQAEVKTEPFEGEVLPDETDMLISGYRDIIGRFRSVRVLAEMWADDQSATVKLLNDALAAQNAITQAILDKYRVRDVSDLDPAQLTPLERETFFGKLIPEWEEVLQVFSELPIQRPEVIKEFINLLLRWPDDTQKASYADQLKFHLLLEDASRRWSIRGADNGYMPEGTTRMEGQREFLRAVAMEYSKRFEGSSESEAEFGITELAKLIDEILRGGRPMRDITPQARSIGPRALPPPRRLLSGPKPQEPLTYEAEQAQTIKELIAEAPTTTPRVALELNEVQAKALDDNAAGKEVPDSRLLVPAIPGEKINDFTVTRVVYTPNPVLKVIEIKFKRAKTYLRESMIGKFVEALRDAVTEAEGPLLKVAGRTRGDRAYNVLVTPIEGRNVIVFRTSPYRGKPFISMMTVGEAKAIATAVDTAEALDVIVRRPEPEPESVVPPIPDEPNPKIEPLPGETVRVEVESKAAEPSPKTTPPTADVEAPAPKPTEAQAARFTPVGAGRRVGKLLVQRTVDTQNPDKTLVEVRRPRTTAYVPRRTAERMAGWLREQADNAERTTQAVIEDKQSPGLRINVFTDADGVKHVVLHLHNAKGKFASPLKLTPTEARALADAVDAELQFDVDVRTPDGAKIQNIAAPSVPQLEPQAKATPVAESPAAVTEPSTAVTEVVEPAAAVTEPSVREVEPSAAPQADIPAPRLKRYQPTTPGRRVGPLHIIRVKDDAHPNDITIEVRRPRTTTWFGEARIKSIVQFLRQQADAAEAGRHPKDLTEKSIRVAVRYTEGEPAIVFTTGEIPGRGGIDTKFDIAEARELADAVEAEAGLSKPEVSPKVKVKKAELNERASAKREANRARVEQERAALREARAGATPAETNPEAVHETMRVAVAQTLEERPVNVDPIVEPTTTKVVAENELNQLRTGIEPGLGKDALAEATEDLYGPEAKVEGKVEGPGEAVKGAYTRRKEAASGEAGLETQGKVMPKESFKPVKSSNIAATAYDPATKELQVEFKDGSIYSYTGVTPDIATGLASVESPGRFLHQQVKGKFDFTKVKAKPKDDPEMQVLEAAVRDSELTPEEIAEMNALDAELKAAEQAMASFAQAVRCALKAGL